MPTVDSNFFELQRRAFLWKPNTTLDDETTALTWDADPNTVVNGNSGGETKLYSLLVGNFYTESDGTLWYKTATPNTWQQVATGTASLDTIYLRLDATNDPVTGELTLSNDFVMTDGQQDLDDTVTDNALAQYVSNSYKQTVVTTTNNSRVHVAGEYISSFGSSFNLTNSFGLSGIIMQTENVGTGTVTGAKAFQSTVINSGGGTITNGVGMVCTHFNTSGTMTNYFGIRFSDLGSNATNTFAFDFQTSFITNNYGLRVAKSTLLRYVQLSDANTGITVTSQDLTFATTTSGDIYIQPAGETHVDSRLDHDDTIADNATSQYAHASHVLTLTTTTNSANTGVAAEHIVSYTSNHNLTATTGLIGVINQTGHSGSGTVTGVKGSQNTLNNTGVGTVTTGRGVISSAFNTGGGTFTTFHAYTCTDSGASMPTNVFWTDLQGGFIENSYAARVADDGVLRYVQLSTANTGITVASQDLTFATTTSGDIQINPVDGLGFFGVTPAVQTAAYTPTNITTDRSYDANATTLDEVADVLGTLIADLQAYGLLQ